MACPKCPKHFHQSQVAKVNWVEVKVVVEKARRIGMIRGGEGILVSTKIRKRKRSDRDRVEAAAKRQKQKKRGRSREGGVTNVGVGGARV